MTPARRSSVLLTALCCASLWIAAALPARAQEGRAPKAPGPPPTRLFNVVMVQAESEGASSFTGLPVAARKAIEDVKDFLPYKAYKLIDTALMRTSRGASTRLKGPDGGEYDVRLDFRQEDDEEQEIYFNHFSVRQLPRSFPLVKKMDPAGGDKSPAMEITEPSTKPKTLIETSFGMRVGETLVVGSSRLNGGKNALIILLTAVD